jgi:hypothetical protein
VDGTLDPTVPADLVPYECPPEVIQLSQNCGIVPASSTTGLPPSVLPNGDTCFHNDGANRWAVRGAINAGMSVFHYVQSIETSGPASDYNVCPAADWEPK